MVVSDLIAYHRGIWSWFDVDYMTEESEQIFMSTVVHDIDRHRAVIPLIVEYPLPTFTGNFITLTYPSLTKSSEHDSTSIVPYDYGQLAVQGSPKADEWYIDLANEEYFCLPAIRSVFFLRI